MQGGIRSWWLLAVCGLEAAVAFLFLTNAQNGFHLRNSVVSLGRLALAAGACAVAAGVRKKPRNWLLVLNGLAFGALGLVLDGVFGYRISFRMIALLVLATALTMAALEWRTGRMLRRESQSSGGVLFVVAAWVLLIFGVAFGVLALTGLKAAPGSNPEFVLFGSYFGFSALSVLALAWRTA